MKGSAQTAAAFARHDLADFAQEFLRRNPLYRRQWATLRLSEPAALQHWGLDFRFRTRRRAAGSSRALAACDRAVRCDLRWRAPSR
ncbi:transcriptional regulator domain-containing protein [Qipengyuania qiaonensis]|uniref:Transcriptional regulator-like domain-containing protein n=1 Tax=Qipengyuania qiaonensis TaxID=2867240 RepID=A0ABS7J335_9SPHN|nr:DUF6499 domain-containing protein [Qipengyuania qiaonensis]MBX7481682.1 hypothetical protein [Qipengyuania qiaonensis]